MGELVSLAGTLKPDNNTVAEFLKPAKELWNEWNIRAVVIFSLTLQTILIFFAPQRKRTARKFLGFLIWSSYLLADWSANYAVGQISDSQGDDPEPGDPPENSDLLAFWAPFLLLHLGGPDTITALALEDNELWLRHLFGLLCQAIASAYVFLQSIPNRLSVPIILMMVGGLIKYFERTRALYLASLDSFKDSMLGEPDPGPNYAKLMEEYDTRKIMNMPTHIVMMEEPEKGEKTDRQIRPPDPLNDLQVVQYAYKYFNIFKGLVVDLIFTFQQRDESKKFFDLLSPEEALRILEVELNFIYDALFTKVEVLHTWLGAACRFIALGTLVSSLCIFIRKKKDGYGEFDVDITYALLIGGIALDVVAVVMFFMSDWTFIKLSKLEEDPDERRITWVDRFLNWVLSIRKLKWKDDTCSKEEDTNKEHQYQHQVLNRKFMFRRWSEYVYAYNLIGQCLGISPDVIHHNKGLIHRIFDNIIRGLFIDRAFTFIIWLFSYPFIAGHQGARKIHKSVDNWIIHRPKKRGLIYRMMYVFKRVLDFWSTIFRWIGGFINWLLDFFGIKQQLEEIRFVSSRRLTKELWVFIFEQVKRKSYLADNPEIAKRISSARGEWTLRDIPSIDQKDRENLVRFVAEVDYDQSILVWHIATEIFYQKERATEKNYNHREFSKVLSDYMMYLLIMQPTLMSAVGGIGKIRFRDTSEEAKRFFYRRHIRREVEKTTSDRGRMHVEKATEEILSVKTEVEPIDVKGDRSKSALFDASMLAQELWRQHTEEKKQDMWEVVSKVWVELLCYAATHCDATQHAAQLSKGGELISFVWLLTAHFGLGDQFQITKGDARAKLIVGK